LLNQLFRVLILRVKRVVHVEHDLRGTVILQVRALVAVVTVGLRKSRLLKRSFRILIASATQRNSVAVGWQLVGWAELARSIEELRCDIVVRVAMHLTVLKALKLDFGTWLEALDLLGPVSDDVLANLKQDKRQQPRQDHQNNRASDHNTEIEGQGVVAIAH
jgi:hypothetical protein